jgi:hypothetical protein
MSNHNLEARQRIAQVTKAEAERRHRGQLVQGTRSSHSSSEYRSSGAFYPGHPNGQDAPASPALVRRSGAPILEAGHLASGKNLFPDPPRAPRYFLKK